MRKLKTMIATIGIVGTLAVPTLALTQSGNGQATETLYNSKFGGNYTIGVSRSFGGENTYGYSWIDTVDNSKNIYTRVKIGGALYPKAYGKGYAQSSQVKHYGSYPVVEIHGLQ